MNISLRDDAQISKVGENIIVDNFYAEPDLVRNAALTKGFLYRVDSVTYPGAECVLEQFDAREVHSQIVKRYLNPILKRGVTISDKSNSKSSFSQGKVRIATARDGLMRPDGVHQDVQEWTGIVYLTPDHLCEGGFDIFRHRHTAAHSENDPRYIDYIENLTSGMDEEMKFITVSEHMRDFENWIKIATLPMKYNRLLIVMAHCFHATGVCFGDGIETGRLSQHFEFYEE
ncbi:DUF6445 family protein [Roseateles sp. MS654]|uniref:DUF6445 family protein n=1 Tax=Roseateles sp. MS654 TaxID=3412685 RepID=UPI003C2BF7A7